LGGERGVGGGGGRKRERERERDTVWVCVHVSEVPQEEHRQSMVAANKQRPFLCLETSTSHFHPHSRQTSIVYLFLINCLACHYIPITYPLHTHTQTHRPRVRQRDRERDKQTDRQIDRYLDE